MTAWQTKKCLTQNKQISYFKDGASNLARGLQVAAQQLFSTVNRQDAPDVVFVLSDGHTNDWETEVLPAARQVKELRATIIPIGLLNGISDDHLRQLATNPIEIVTAFDPNELQTKIPSVNASACQHRIAGKSRFSVCFPFANLM